MEKENAYNIGMEALLPRYVEGLTTDAENRRVEAWIEADEDNRRLAEQIHALHLASDTLSVGRQVDTEKAWKRVEGKMGKRLSGWIWLQRIAAVLFIPLLVVATWLYAERAAKTEDIRMVEVRTNPGMTTTVVLPDSTLVCLNSETSLRYPSRFEGDLREVELSGEAYFEVRKDAARRFVVSASHDTRIEVYGTSFNVEAYAADSQVSTTLVEGSVGFCFTDGKGTPKKVRLTPRHKLVYEPAEGSVALYTTTCQTETAWKDGCIVFNNTPLEEALRILGKRYNVEFVVKDLRMKDYAFTGSFTTQRLERIMEYFKISSRIRWRYVDSDDMSALKQRIEIY